VLVEWDLAFLGDTQPGATLPFLIKDRTPREWRVPPSTRVAEPEELGVAMVILGVEDLERSIDLFRRVYGWPVPAVDEDAGLGARLAHFPGTPVMLAAASPGGGWPTAWAVLARRRAPSCSARQAWRLRLDAFHSSELDRGLAAGWRGSTRPG
jgi:hypothetical protein